MKYTLEEILNQQKNIVIHTKYEKDAILLLKRFHELKLEWCDGVSYLDINNWKDYQDKTCYQPARGHFSRYDYWENESFEILEYKDIKHLFFISDIHMTEFDV